LDLTFISKDNHIFPLVSPIINQQVDVEVETIYDISIAFCYFLAKNEHLDLKAISFEDGFSRFSFIPDGAYTPVTQITCVGIDNYGHRYESEVLVNFDELANKVTIELLTPTVEPGMNASIRVSASLHSTISLLAIDHSKKEILSSLKI
jgi:hypothetical protein